MVTDFSFLSEIFDFIENTYEVRVSLGLFIIAIHQDLCIYQVAYD